MLVIVVGDWRGGDGWSSVHEEPQSKEAGNSLQPIPQPLSMYDTGLHFMKKLNRF